MVDKIPDGSIYYWCYIQGLKHADFDELRLAVIAAGKELRPKDTQNYWNGWYNSDLYLGNKRRSILEFDRFPRSSRTFFEMDYSEYPDHPYVGMPEVANRWVPCTEDGKPLIKWSQGCMLRSEAECYQGCKSLAENLKGCQHIAIDIDGDHDEGYLNLDVIGFGERLSTITKTFRKPKDHYLIEDENGIRDVYMCGSMHLIFKVDHVIPTMHFSNAHIDIIGNEKNSIRYLKNKRANHLPAMEMTDDIWSMIVEYIRQKENK